MSGAATVRLFSYGTLQQENVQQTLFGRTLAGMPDALPGYASRLLEIVDPEVLATSGERFHPVVMETGNPDDSVAGTVFAITDAELEAVNDRESLFCPPQLQYSLAHALIAEPELFRRKNV